MRKVGIAVLVAFVVTLAVVIGNRMSAEAMAVVVGVVCGVAAGIPMALLIMLVLNRNQRREQDDEWSRDPQGMRHGAYPPVVVIQGGAPMSNALPLPYVSSPVQAGARQFHIVGDAD